MKYKCYIYPSPSKLLLIHEGSVQMCHGRHHEILAEWEGRVSSTLWLRTGWFWGNTDQGNIVATGRMQLEGHQDQVLE